MPSSPVPQNFSLEEIFEAEPAAGPPHQCHAPRASLIDGHGIEVQECGTEQNSWSLAVCHGLSVELLVNS